MSHVRLSTKRELKSLRSKVYNFGEFVYERPVAIRSWTIEILFATQESLAAATPEAFHSQDLGDLPKQFRKELQVPQAEPYAVLQCMVSSTGSLEH
ncbi:unnamed protein product [Wuchereria bancrofti]|uniref:Uncharacterized protein n=1 Tax=Wuchereria bancrofti TaxID=6293 RepID=A0A3P7FJA0_WUCBA|nr:unnamed protein product [Wuchereria bancrofti]